MPRDALISRARHVVAASRERLTRESRAPRIPELGTDLFVSREPRWQWCLRGARTPAFGIAVIAYLIGAWIVVGATSPPPTKGSTTGDTDIIPRTALVAVPDSPSGSGGTAGTNGLTPNVDIDAKFFNGMQKVVDGLGTQHIVAPNGSAADTPATVATPQPHLPELQNESATDAPTSDMPTAATAQGLEPGPPSSAVAPTGIETPATTGQP